MKYTVSEAFQVVFKNIQQLHKRGLLTYQEYKGWVAWGKELGCVEEDEITY